MSLAARRARFRALHLNGCFLLPNPWDAGGALRLAALGFQALATSSSAAAATLGKQDHQLTLDETLANMAAIAAATDLPVNADFEGGFSEDPDTIAANVTRAIATGIAGFSIEDRPFGGTDRNVLRDEAHAVACIAAARRAIDASGVDVMLVARTEAYLAGRQDIDFACRRLGAFADAGADCLFAPGVTDLAEIGTIVAAVAPKPVNVLLFGPDMQPAALAAAGVRRISTGGALARTAWEAFDTAALHLRESLP